MSNIWLPPIPGFIRGLGIEQFGWRAISQVYSGVYCFCPQRIRQITIKKKTPSHLYHGSVCAFSDAILLWSILHTQLPLYSFCGQIFCEIGVDVLTPIVTSKAFNFARSFTLNLGLECFECIKNIGFSFKKVDTHFSTKIVNK